MSFEDPNNQTRGDMHYWDVWHEAKPFKDFKSVYPRFMSEFGLQSFPSNQLIHDYITEGERNIFSSTMKTHQKNKGGNERIMHYVAELYRFPKDLKSVVYCSQLIQAEGIRTAVEHWRRNMGRCMGSLYWQLNDCWPVASWSSIDYGSNWKALHYFAKRFYNPLLLSCDDQEKHWSFYGVNDHFTAVEATIRLNWFESGVLTETLEQSIILEPGSNRLPIEFLIDREALGRTELRSSYLQYEMQSADGLSSSAVWLPLPAGEMKLLKPDLHVKVSENDSALTIQIHAETLILGLMLEVPGRRVIFSDNFFDMVPGEIRSIDIIKSKNPEISNKIINNEVEFFSLFDSFTG